MKRQYSMLLCALLGAGGLFWSVAVIGCEFGTGEATAHSEIVYPVVTRTGQLVGQVRQQRDGFWEAIVLGQGTLNEQFATDARARAAVCEGSAGD